MFLTKLRDGVVGSTGRWVLAAVGLLIAGGFVFWNVDFKFGGSTFAAKVNGDEISLDEFQRTLQQQEAQYQQLYKVDLSDAMRRQIRRSVLDRLIEQQAMAQRVQSQGYRISDQRLIEAIHTIEPFQVDGKFDVDTYKRVLSYQGMTPTAFEALERQQLSMLELEQGISASSFLTPGELKRYVELSDQKRRFGYALFKAADFRDKVKVTDDEIASYYKEHKPEFMTQEAAALQYVELTRGQVADTIKVTDEDLHKYYDEHKDQYSTPEERHVQHILITPKKGETDAQAKARAEAALKRVESGEDFAKVAKDVSEDPGTAQQGGDLGWIGRGILKGPFEDTLFAMKPGEVKGPVKTSFGYHIIKLDGIRGGKSQTFDEVKEKIAKEIRTQRADDAFYNESNKLADAAFDAYDNLDSVAKQFNVPLKTVDRFPRSGDPAVFKNSAPIVDAVFGSEPLQKGLDSQMLKLSDDDVVVVRVTDRFPSKEKPLEQVSDQIRETLVQQKAGSLAADAATAYVADLPKDLGRAFLGADAAEASDAAGGAAADQAADTGAQADSKDAAGKDAKPAADKQAKDKQAKAEQAKTAKAPAAKKGQQAAADKSKAEAKDQPAPPAAELAMKHNGSWVAPTWVARGATTSVPTAVLAQAFELPAPTDDSVVAQPVRLTSGDHAVVLLAAVEDGKLDALKGDDLDQTKQQLINEVGSAELNAYSATVREQAKVRVPPSVLEPGS